jgi:hypothetical protein
MENEYDVLVSESGMLGTGYRVLPSPVEQITYHIPLIG